jgi:hypothetical protein
MSSIQLATTAATTQISPHSNPSISAQKPPRQSGAHADRADRPPLVLHEVISEPRHEQLFLKLRVC